MTRSSFLSCLTCVWITSDCRNSDSACSLLIFFMITSTLIAPNALKLLLPQSRHQTSAKAVTTVSITEDLQFFVETDLVELSNLERILKAILAEEAEPTIALHVDKRVPMEQVVQVMNIAKDNQYKLILATTPN